MFKLSKESEDILLKIYKEKNVLLEGNITKVLDSDNKEFKDYLKIASDHDRDNRKKRLEITKQIQSQNRDLINAQDENDKLMVELRDALNCAETAKQEAEKLRDAAVEDLDSLQKRTQFELIHLIVRIALYIIIGVGLTTTILYFFAMVRGYDTKILESAWSNMFGILLTNSFSIIGTIMGVKYATNKEK